MLRRTLDSDRPSTALFEHVRSMLAAECDVEWPKDNRTGRLFVTNNGKAVAHVARAAYELQLRDGAPMRVVASIPHADTAVLHRLIECLTPPFTLLYIHHTPRTENSGGRYESPPLTLAELQSFLDTYSDYLANDGRYDLWVYSHDDEAQIVWDHHNLAFCYGQTERFIAVFDSLGFSNEEITGPATHAHRFREEFDETADDVLNAFDWQWSPLEPTDGQ